MVTESKTRISGLYVALLWIKVKAIGLSAKILRLLNKTAVYESRTGIKEINTVFLPCSIKDAEECILSPDELYLGIDFLNDRYSLIDTPIKESPHFKLMESLHAGNDGRNTEYTIRMINGALDERYEILAYYLDRSYFKSCFSTKVKDIHKASVIVYKLNDRFYIHDGKHRAALCALVDTDVKCRVVKFTDVRKEFNPKKIDMVMRNEKYSKHQKMFGN